MRPYPPVPIRVATGRDIPAMVALLGELFAIEADFRVDPEAQRRGLQMLLQGPDRALVMVAEVGGRVAGMVTVQLLVSTAEGGAVGLLEDLVVGASWRGRGVGSALLDAAEQWALVRGVLRLQLLADRENAAALGFYAARGWAGTQLTCLRRSERTAVQGRGGPARAGRIGR